MYLYIIRNSLSLKKYLNWALFLFFFLRQSRGRLCLCHLLSRYGPHLDQGVQSGWTRKLLLRPWKKGLISWCQRNFRLGWVQRSCWPCNQVHSGLHRRQGEEGERYTGAHELAQQPCREEGNNTNSCWDTQRNEILTNNDPWPHNQRV